MPPSRGRHPASPTSPAARARYRRILRFASLTLAQLWWFEIALPAVGLRRWAYRNRVPRLQHLARRFHALATELGGLMIKVGQFLSSRLDILPPEVTKELEGLQDEVAPETFDAIRVRTEQELGMPLTRAYAWFDPTPIAAASLGQAHRARLTPAIAADLGFTDVVVKVQRPGIDEVVAVDLAALRRVARWLARIRLVSTRADAPALVEEFAATSLEEIDYRHEAANAVRFGADFAQDPAVGSPEVVWERSSLRVLTLSDVTAIKVTDVTALTAAGIDPAEVAQELARVTFQQVFVHGFFHADPHPGNIFVTPLAEPVEGPSGRSLTWRLTFIDFGMMGEISDSLRAGLRDFILAAVRRDSRGLITALEHLDVLLPTANTDELELAMDTLFGRFGGMGIAELQRVDPREFEAFARQFGETIRALPFQLPENFLLLLRTISLVSGGTSALDPDFNMWDAVDPFARDILSPRGVDSVRDLGRRGLAYATTLAGLPRRLDEVITRVDRGQVAIRTPDVDRRLRSIERVISRAVSAVVFATLLFAGVLLRPTDEVLGWVLMGASIIPLAHVVATWRSR
jgi:predicted unusual protein kinase regulating ubiquinone biosynthesis (AarF/ABC1/UbiB family)